MRLISFSIWYVSHFTPSSSDRLLPHDPELHEWKIIDGWMSFSVNYINIYLYNIILFDWLAKQYIPFLFTFNTATQLFLFFFFTKFVLQSREKLRLTHSSYLHEINKIRVKIQIIALHYSPNVHPSKPLIMTRTWFEFPLLLPSRKLSLFLSPAFLFVLWHLKVPDVILYEGLWCTSSKYKWIERDKLILFKKKKRRAFYVGSSNEMP